MRFQQLHQYEKQSHVFQDQENVALQVAPKHMADADITLGDSLGIFWRWGITLGAM